MCTRARFVGENTFSVPCDWRDDTGDRGDPNCAGADDLTGKSRGPGGGKNLQPNSQVRTCGEEFHVNSKSSCFFLRVSLHVAQLVPLSVRSPSTVHA